MNSTATIREVKPKDFPGKLREIPDPPEKLFVRGADFDESVPALSVVGSRKMTDYGRRACETLIEGLRGYNVQIISGLAYGIDSVAHRAALKTGLKTVAVPGSGIHDSALYPKAHVNLARQILEAGGTVLSEFEPKQIGAPWTFPKRNRIMAGLSEAILLIEAAERSGTLITGRLGLEYNREICVVPGEIFSPTSKGTNALLRDGAAPILSAEDLIELMHLEKLESGEAAEKANDDEGLLSLFDAQIEKDELLRLAPNPKGAQAELSKLELIGAIEVRNGVVYKR